MSHINQSQTISSTVFFILCRCKWCHFSCHIARAWDRPCTDIPSPVPREWVLSCLKHVSNMSSSTIVSIFGFLRLPGQVQRQRRPCHGLRQRCNGNAAATHVTRTSFRRRLSKLSFPTEFMHQNKYGLAKSVHSQDAQVSCQLMSTHVNCQRVGHVSTDFFKL